MKTSRALPLVLMIAGMTGCATPQSPKVGLSASGQVEPGVYGVVDVRNRPVPPLVYPEPLVIVPLVREAEPIYMHVPPEHAARWSMFCHRYHACEQPVYFVKSAEYAADDTSAKKGTRDGDSRRYRMRQ